MAQFLDLAFRPATPDDLERLIEIHFASYPDGRSADERRRNFTANPLGSLDDLVVATSGDRIVGHAFLFRLEAFFGGVAVKTGGIASVAVAPEVRGHGVATALLAHHHQAADIRGAAITWLYGFRHGFYTRLGYAVGGSRKKLSVDPRSIPRSWRTIVRKAAGEDRGAIEACHLRAAAAATGWLRRPAALWDRFFSRERRQILVLPDRSGYVSFELHQNESHAETLLAVDELVATNDGARRALWGVLGSMESQVDRIEIETEASDPIDAVLTDPDGRRHGTAAVEHALGTVVGGPMVRIEDVPRAIEARGYLADGAFDVVIDDEIAMSVRVEDGRAAVAEAQGRAVLQTSRRGLAGVLYGGLRPSDAVRLGLAEADARTLDRIDPILAVPPLAPLDPF